jgi:cytochrome c
MQINEKNVQAGEMKTGKYKYSFGNNEDCIKKSATKSFILLNINKLTNFVAMNTYIRLLAWSLVACFIVSCNTRSGKPRVLVFSKTSGYRHSAIENGKAAIIKLGQQNGFVVDTTEDAGYFTEDSLKNYSAVVFLNTTGNVLDNYQEADFERYIQSGGGYVGIHAATDCEYDWGWYGRLVGAYFESHPAQQEATLHVADASHSSTKHLPKDWKRKDEWYNFKKLSTTTHVLLTIDEKTYEGGKNGNNHPMAWYHDYDGGRAFYTELGHTEASYTEENFLKHILGGIQYSIGKNQKLDYAKATTGQVPEEDRFTKHILTQGEFFEPTEMTVLPNLDVLIAQRRGELMLYKNSTKTVKQAGYLNVYWKTEKTPNVNAEEGFLGLKADPNFATNHFVYLFYSPKDTSVNRLSRFKFEHDSLDMASEKVILQFYSQREICCHTGGSIDFAGDGKTLFLSTGDNSTPFNEPNQRFVNRGFGPLDDRPGHEQYDARRSSANTNDLRGKILRIKLKEDGTYEIPAGNLFKPGTPNTRPEIYVMGNRNPYRIMVDKKNGWVYWGEVGPDANNDSLDTRGPRGYDELNQARQAGNFGWPMFVGNNYAYRSYDYGTGASGPAFDPTKPLNASRNNTGIQQLPPLQPAFIWYPYANSPDFPQLGTGGRNAMAGPVYYTDMYPDSTRLPDYYNKKLFIYDWIRGWIKVVTMQPNGDFDKMEPFIEHTPLHNCIDMEVGPDGKLYLLEYGTGWFSKNPDAGLSRIDYNAGNRAPKVTSLTVDKTSGSLPLTITAKVDAKDPDKDSLTYIWRLGSGIQQQTNKPVLTYTLKTPGDYNVSVEVQDNTKATTKSESVNVYAGNEAPEVQIEIAGNKTFYWPGKAVQYSVQVKDKEDTAAAGNKAGLVVTADYMEGSDKAGASMGHQVLTEAMMGKNLMATLDCKTCHKTDEKSIGPSFTDVAKRYQKQPNSAAYLVNKILKGSSGVWGEVPMPGHPNLPESDARQVVAWIQSLATSGKQMPSLPAKGSVPATLNKPVADKGLLYISASYTDKGGAGIKPLTSQSVVTLRNPKLYFDRVKDIKGFTSFNFQGHKLMISPTTEGWFSTDSFDLTGISQIHVHIGWIKPLQFGYVIDLHLDAPTGKKLGSITIPADATASQEKPASKLGIVTLEKVTDGQLHAIYLVSRPANAQEANEVALRYMEFK